METWISLDTQLKNWLNQMNKTLISNKCSEANRKLYTYYGAADKRIAVVSVNLHKLLHELLASEIEVGIGFLAGQIFGLTLKEEKSLTQIKNLLNQNEKVYNSPS